MGDPRKIKKQYSTPIHPWQKARIDEENALITTYGLKNKREIWRLASMVRESSRQAKRLIANTTHQGELERNQLIQKLVSLNVLQPESTLDDVLGLKTHNMIERRLQTLVYKKGLASSVKMARQIIVHGHIMISGRKITIPSYLVKRNEEDSIAYVPTSGVLRAREGAPVKAGPVPDPEE
jgi:small subunit ribosomal protein S4